MTKQVEWVEWVDQVQQVQVQQVQQVQVRQVQQVQVQVQVRRVQVRRGQSVRLARSGPTGHPVPVPPAGSHRGAVCWMVVLGCVASLGAAGIDKFGDIEITTFVHSSVQLEHAGKVIQVDPWSVGDLSKAKPADLILITDDVGHHLDVKAIRQLRKPGAPVVIAANGKTQLPDGLVVANGERTVAAGIPIEAVAAYDVKPGDPYHPKGEANGYIITLGKTRIYIAGVTECVPEVRAVRNIDVAFFPMNVPLQRMEPAAAVDCIRSFRPKVVYPYHYDQDWVARVQKGAPRPEPTTRGLDELKTGLAKDGIEVRLAAWYPR